MSDEDAEMVTFRLAPRDRDAIRRLIERGEFRNRSDFLRYAVKATLTAYDAAPAPALDLALEQVELPDHAPPRAAPRRSRDTQRFRS